MVAYNKFNITTEDMLSGVHDFSAHSFKLLLSNTTPSDANQGKADIVEIAAGNGYTAGGVTVTITSTSQTDGLATVFAADITVTASGGSIGPFQHCVLYNDTSTGDGLIGGWDRGSPLTLSNGQSFRISIPDLTGALQIGEAAPPGLAPPSDWIYVSTTGSDSGLLRGTYELPYATLQKAHDVALAGDTIAMLEGTYYPTSTTQITRDGSSGSPITITKWPSDATVIIDGTNIPAGNYSASCAIRGNSANYWIIDGLEIRHCPDFGIKWEGTSTGCTWKRLEVHHTGVNAGLVNIGSLNEGKGGYVDGAHTGMVIEYSDFHHNSNASGGGADGLQVASTTPVTIRYNRFYGNWDDGLDLYMVTYTANQGAYTIYGNQAWGNGYRFDGVTPGGDGAGFKLGGARADSNNGNHTVYENLAWGNRVYGFSANGHDGDMNIYNNTAYNNFDSDVGNEYNWYIETTGHTLVNNIFCAPGSNYIIGGNTETTNSWQIGGTIDASDFQSVDPTGCDGPRDADGNLPVLTYLRLHSSSNMRGAGTNVGLGTDLGAYQFA